MRRLAELALPGRAIPQVDGSSILAEVRLAEARLAATVGRRQPGPSPNGPHDHSTPDMFRRPAGQRLLTGGAEP